MNNTWNENRLLQDIATYLIKHYKMNIFDAQKAVSTSIINNLLKTDRDVAMHYSIPYLAKDVYNEYQEFAMCV